MIYEFVTIYKIIKKKDENSFLEQLKCLKTINIIIYYIIFIGILAWKVNKYKRPFLSLTFIDIS